MFREVEPEDLIKFGLIPNWSAACRWSPTLAELSEDALVQILTEPKNALVKQYAKLLSDGRRGPGSAAQRAARRSPARRWPARPARAACAPSWSSR
jgi:ATP-dependent Clp protease ATP-binding subunit ClpX